jgi:hypothetical protein
MTQGSPNGNPTIDCGAICMGPKQMQHYQKLVDDAVKKVSTGGAGTKKEEEEGVASIGFQIVIVFNQIYHHAYSYNLSVRVRNSSTAGISPRPATPSPPAPSTPPPFLPMCQRLP